MSLTTASIELHDNQMQIKDANINGLLVQGDQTCI